MHGSLQELKEMRKQGVGKVGEIGEMRSCYVIKGLEFLGRSPNLFLRAVDSYW